MPIQSSDMPAIEEIKQLKARYFRFLDTKQWTKLRGLFTDDAVFEGTFDPFKGPDDFIAGVSKFNQNTVTVHHGHMPEIRIISPTTARAIWALADFIEITATEGQPPRAQRGFTGFGHYQEKYRKEGYGKMVMKEAMDQMPKLFPNQPIKISAQAYLQKFYEGFGFEKVSEPYLEDDIPHIAMVFGH